MCRTKCIHYAYIMHTLCIHYINNFFPQSRLFLRCCHAQKTKFEKMAGKEEQCCSSCFNNTKYTCLRCQEYFCIPCSVFENDETVKGWKAGTSVAYCFREVMEESEKVAGKYDSDESRKDRDLAKQEERSSRKRKSIEEDTTKRSVWKQHNHMFSFNYGTEILMMP